MTGIKQGLPGAVKSRLGPEVVWKHPESLPKLWMTLPPADRSRHLQKFVLGKTERVCDGALYVVAVGRWLTGRGLGSCWPCWTPPG